MNGMKATDTLKQTIYNPQKKSEHTPWIEASGKKRNRNRPEITISRKQPKKNEYQLSKSVTP